MADLSNKTLALLVGVAIAISVVGIFVAQRGSITGLATSGTGWVNLTVEEQVWINISDNSTVFPNGSIEQDSYCADIHTDATANANWTDASGANDPIVVTNLGNTGINITFQSDKDGGDFTGGTASNFSYKTAQAVATCTGNVAAFTAIQDADTEYQGCSNLTQGGAFNTFFKAHVCNDVAPGTYTAVITYTAHSLP